MRDYQDRPSTQRAANMGIQVPYGYKVNSLGQLVPDPNQNVVTDPYGNPTGIYSRGAVQSWQQPGAEQPEDNGYSGYGSGAPPQKSLASSPEWLAYLNALGLEQSQFEADIQRQRGVLTSEANRQIGDLAPGYEQQRRSLSGGLYARGMERSGEKMKTLAESRASQGRAQGSIQAALTSQLSGLESQLSGKLIDLAARRAQQELALRTQGYV